MNEPVRLHKVEEISSFDSFCMKICPYVLIACIFLMIVLVLYIMVVHGASVTGTEANQYYYHMEMIL